METAQVTLIHLSWPPPPVTASNNKTISVLRALASSASWNLLEKPEAGATICSHFTVMETEAKAVWESRGQQDIHAPHNTLSDSYRKNGSVGASVSLRVTNSKRRSLGGDGYKVDALQKFTEVRSRSVTSCSLALNRKNTSGAGEMAQ